MEMIKKLIIATALVASFMPVSPVYAMGLDEEGDSKEMEATGVQENSAAAVPISRDIDLDEIQRRQDALEKKEYEELKYAVSELLVDLSTVSKDQDNSPAEERLRELLERGAPVHNYMQHGTSLLSPLALAVVFKLPSNIINMLIDYGSDVDEMVEGGADYSMPLVAFAIATGNSDGAELLLKRNADPNGADCLGATILMISAMQGDIRMVRLLLSSGACINEQNEQGKTALLEACEVMNNPQNAAEIVRTLVFNGADATLGMSDSELIVKRLKRLKNFSSIEAEASKIKVLSPLCLEELRVRGVESPLLEELQNQLPLTKSIAERDKALQDLGVYAQAVQHPDLLNILPQPLWHIIGEQGLYYAEDDALSDFVSVHFADQWKRARLQGQQNERRAVEQADEGVMASLREVVGARAQAAGLVLQQTGADEAFFYDIRPEDEEEKAGFDAELSAQGSSAVVMAESAAAQDAPVIDSATTMSSSTDAEHLTVEQRRDRVRLAWSQDNVKVNAIDKMD